MTDLTLVPVSGEVMEQNLERSLAERPHQPWAFNGWKRQMQALQPGGAIAFLDLADERGRQVYRFTSGQAVLSCRRAVVGTLRSAVERTDEPYFAGYPYEFRFEAHRDEAFDPPLELDGLAKALQEAVPGLVIDGEQLRELVINAKSNKIGVFVDGAPRLAAFFRAAPTPSRREAPVADEPAEGPTEEPTTSVGQAIATFAGAVGDAGLVFLGSNATLPIAFLSALVAKRFAILSGLSGSGKTRLARALGQWLGADADGRRTYTVIPVRPDWTSPDHLLGYEDALLPAVGGRRAWAAPEALRFMLRAHATPNRLHLLVLDEMNLAHVERYFADVLSGIESGEPVLPALEQGSDGYWRLGDGPERVPVPDNLLIVGTVNVDETTYQFSPKVLDRAFSFDFRVSTDEIGAAVRAVTDVAPATASTTEAVRRAVVDGGWHLDERGPQADVVREELIVLHQRLGEIGFEFGHRTFAEAMRFTAVLARAGIVDRDESVDWVVMAKVLPRLHGSRRQLEPFLVEMLATATGADPDEPAMPRTARKVGRLLDVARANQFVSFAE